MCWARRHVGDSTLWLKASCSYIWPGVSQQNAQGTLRSVVAYLAQQNFEIFKERLQHELPVRDRHWNSQGQSASWVEWGLSEWAMFIRLMKVQIWHPPAPPAVWGECSTQGQWQPSLWRHTNQFLPVCLLYLLILARAQGEWLGVSMCMGPFRGFLSSQHPSISPWQDRIASDVHSQLLWGLLFSILIPGLGPSLFGMDLYNWDILLNSQQPHVGVGPVHFMFPPLLLISIWPLLYNLSYRSSTWLVFR